MSTSDPLTTDIDRREDMKAQAKADQYEHTIKKGIQAISKRILS